MFRYGEGATKAEAAGPPPEVKPTPVPQPVAVTPPEFKPSPAPKSAVTDLGYVFKFPRRARENDPFKRDGLSLVLKMKALEKQM